MEKLVYSQRFALGVEPIDSQHKQLFGIFARLDESVDAGRHNEAVGVIDELVAYAIVHFREEESLMERFDYPRKAAHAMQHGQFLDEVSKFEFDAFLDDPTLPRTIRDFLAGWLRTHVTTVDVEFGAYLKENGFKP